MSGISRRSLLASAAVLSVLANPAVSRAVAFAGEPTAPGAPDLSQMTPLEQQVYQEAQRIYDELVDTHGSVGIYANLVLRDRLSYQSTLNQSRFYDEAYDATVNYSAAFASVALGVLKQSPEDVIAPFADEVLNVAIEESFLGEMAKDVGTMSAGEFIYAQASMGARMVSSAELRDVMELAENNGGYFPTVADAARFIVLYEGNRAGFAALRMGKAYYLEQLQKSPIQVLFEMAQDIALDEVVGSLIPFEGFEGWAVGYGSSIVTDALQDGMDAIVASYNDPHITAWAAELKEIEAEMERIFTAPLAYTVSREDGLMNYQGNEFLQLSADAWLREGFEFYHGLGFVGGVDVEEGGPVLDSQVAKEYLAVLNGLVHRYGSEHMLEDYETHELCKVGVSGGYLVDISGDGRPQMLVVYRSTLASSMSIAYDEMPAQTSAFCELWACPGTQAGCVCTWELRDGVFSGLEGDEFLNVCIAEQGIYIETGLATVAGAELSAGADTPLHALMALDGQGNAAQLGDPSEAGQILRRVPVAVGGRIHLANCAAFERLLAQAATASVTGAVLATRTDPGEYLDLVTYVGDPGACQLSVEVAQAFADSIAAEPLVDPDSLEPAYLEAMLVDAGDDGYPFLIKALPQSSFDLDGGGHFIADAIFCCWRDGAVREYPFVEEAQYVGEGGSLSVALIAGADRGGVNVLAVDVAGIWVGTQAPR